MLAVLIVEYCLSSFISHLHITGDDVAFSDECFDIKLDRTDFKSFRKIKVCLLVRMRAHDRSMDDSGMVVYLAGYRNNSYF